MITENLIFRIVNREDVTAFEKEVYNEDYEAIQFTYNDITVKSRLGKKTPTKTGYFTTLWTKDDNEDNRPLHVDEMCDFLMVGIKDDEQEGMFIFPKDVLVQKHYLSHDDVVGKMGFRVYAPWHESLNETAQETFEWQKDYFVNFKDVVVEDQ